jgi:hypothetical protein
VRALGVLAAVAGALALVPFASAGVKNACHLVTAADVSTALKGKVGAGTHQKIGAFNACIYTKRRVTVTVKTRLISHAAYAKVVRTISGTALKASDISDNAWVFFVPGGTALDDWKKGNEIGYVVIGAGGDAVLILKQLAKAARSRI